MSFVDWKKQNDLMSSKEYSIKRSADAVALQAAYMALQRPDCLVGAVPLYTAQMVEVASSEDVLKFRSVGGQFLAHQHGGAYAVRVDARLKGPNAGLILLALQVMHAHGDAYEGMNTKISDMFQRGLNISSTDIFNKEYLLGMNNRHWAEDASTEFSSPNDYNYIKSTWHKTFTIMTRLEMLFDMFIESLIYWRTIDDDPDIINVSMLCRKFIPPRIPIMTGLSYDQKLYSGPQEVVEVGRKHFHELHHSSANKTFRKTKYKDRVPSNMQSVDWVINTTYRMNPIIQMHYRSVVEGYKDGQIASRRFSLLPIIKDTRLSEFSSAYSMIYIATQRFDIICDWWRKSVSEPVNTAIFKDNFPDRIKVSLLDKIVKPVDGFIYDNDILKTRPSSKKIEGQDLSVTFGSTELYIARGGVESVYIRVNKGSKLYIHVDEYYIIKINSGKYLLFIIRENNIVNFYGYEGSL